MGVLLIKKCSICASFLAVSDYHNCYVFVIYLEPLAVKPIAGFKLPGASLQTTEVLNTFSKSKYIDSLYVRKFFCNCVTVVDILDLL